MVLSWLAMNHYTIIVIPWWIPHPDSLLYATLAVFHILVLKVLWGFQA